jgi:uncharacterized ion transporter superfamily protein YfcC
MNGTNTPTIALQVGALLLVTLVAVGTAPAGAVVGAESVLAAGTDHANVAAAGSLTLSGILLRIGVLVVLVGLPILFLYLLASVNVSRREKRLPVAPGAPLEEDPDEAAYDAVRRRMG